MKNIDSTFDETYSKLISFYKNTSNREEIRTDEISDLTQIAQFYFDFQQKFKKTVDFELSIIYTKNVGLFILNDSVILSGEHLDFKSEGSIHEELDISAYVLTSPDKLKSIFRIDSSNESFYDENNSLDDPLENDEFEESDEEKNDLYINKKNVFDCSSEISNYLQQHFDLILLNNKETINNSFDYLRDTSLFFDSAKSASSVYLKDQFKYKTNIDFSFILSNYLPEKRYTLDQYKEAFRNINDFLILNYDIDISEKIKHTLLFQSNEQNKKKYIINN